MRGGVGFFGYQRQHTGDADGGKAFQYTAAGGIAGQIGRINLLWLYGLGHMRIFWLIGGMSGGGRALRLVPL